MRRIPWHFPALFLLSTLGLPARSVVRPQEPEPAPKAERAGAQDPGRQGGNRGGNRRGNRADRQGRGNRRRQPVIAITAGHVHPVSGPTIENGVVLIRGERILAVGKQGEVEIPESATVRAFPAGHVYPGLIDAETDAFTDPATQNGQLDAGMALADDLQLRHTRDDALAAAGITVAYVSAPAGQGAIVRPRKDGFEVWEDKSKAAVQLRMTRGPVPTHALARQQQLDALLKTFDGLDKYEEAKQKYNKDLDKYAEDFKKWLEWHEKNKAKKKAEDGKDGGSESGNARRGGNRPGNAGGANGRRRRGGPPGGGNAMNGGELQASPEFEAAFFEMLELLAAEPAATAQDPQGKPPQGEGEKPAPGAGDEKGDDQKPAAKKDEAPKRPTYPKPVKEDPKKEALLAVLEGEMPLRVEAHRPDELRAALALQRAAEVPLLVLEQAYGVAQLAETISEAGATVVLTDVLPSSMPKLYEAFDPAAAPQQLDKAGVPFAIATGKARHASLLPLMAATAVGRGLAPAAALRAITLTPAEILGINRDTGSLTRGKFADVVIFDRPLFESDSRVLLVLGKGRTEYEAN